MLFSNCTGMVGRIATHTFNAHYNTYVCNLMACASLAGEMTPLCMRYEFPQPIQGHHLTPFGHPILSSWLC